MTSANLSSSKLIVRNNRYDRNLLQLRPIKPKYPMGLWCIILNIGTENFATEYLIKLGDGVRLKSWVVGIFRKKSKGLFELLFKAFFCLIIHDGLSLISSLCSEVEFKWADWRHSFHSAGIL